MGLRMWFLESEEDITKDSQVVFNDLSKDKREFFEEGAAIIEYAGGLSKRDAKRERSKYELAERMAIMGENCEPEQTEPYVTDFGVLVIPWNSNPRYHYWKPGGQSVCITLRELGRCDLIPKYKSIYSN